MTGKHEAVVWSYVRDVISGERVAGEDLILACKRFQDDWNSGRWDVRCDEADFVIDNSGTPLETRRQIEERLRNDEIM